MLIGALCGCARRLRNPFSRTLLLEASDWSGYALCSVSRARCAGSSLTCAKRIAQPILRVCFFSAWLYLPNQKKQSTWSAVLALSRSVRKSLSLSGCQSNQCQQGFVQRSSASGVGCAFCAGQGGARRAGDTEQNVRLAPDACGVQSAVGAQVTGHASRAFSRESATKPVAVFPT